jgi:hypothetical protein
MAIAKKILSIKGIFLCSPGDRLDGGIAEIDMCDPFSVYLYPENGAWKKLLQELFDFLKQDLGFNLIRHNP